MRQVVNFSLLVRFVKLSATIAQTILLFLSAADVLIFGYALIREARVSFFFLVIFYKGTVCHKMFAVRFLQCCCVHVQGPNFAVMAHDHCTCAHVQVMMKQRFGRMCRH